MFEEEGHALIYIKKKNHSCCCVELGCRLAGGAARSLQQSRREAMMAGTSVVGSGRIPEDVEA